MAKNLKPVPVDYANGKIKNPKNGFAYQVGTNIILIGSKESEP